MFLFRPLAGTIPIAGTFGAAFALGWAAYRYGLFYEEDFYRFEGLLFIGVLIWLAVRVFGRRKAEAPIWVLLPLGIAAIYGLKLAANPVSVKGTVDAALRWGAYAGWALLLWTIWRKPERRGAGMRAIQIAGLFVLASGWLGWFGWSSFPNMVLKFEDVELSATGSRLAGFLQYPNSYGAVMAFFLLVQLQAWASANAAGWRRCPLLPALTAVPYGAALMLTESRGAAAALLLGIVLAFILSPSSARPKLLLASGFTVAGSALTALAAWRGNSQVDGAGAGEVWAVALCMLVGAAALVGAKWMSREQRPLPGWLPWLVAGAGAFVAGWTLLGNAGERLAGNYGTVSSRSLFYADAWRMFQDAPWLGFGGESWRMLSGLYQSRPYVGNEVHSGYLDILLDVGLVGLALLALMLGLFVVRIWQYRKDALAPLAILLAHAAIDFDWSYGFVWLLLLAWVVLHLPPASAAAAVRPGALLRLGRGALAALLACSAAAGLWAAWRSDAAVSARAAAELRAALDANPAWNRIRLELAPLLQLRERASLLEAGLRYEPQSPPLLLKLGMTYAELGEAAQAGERLREALRLDRFNREAQTAAISAMANLAENLRAYGQADQAREAAETAVDLFETYRSLDREVSAMVHPANDKRFALTTAAKFHAARSLLMLSRDGEAHSLLHEVTQADDGDWREEAMRLLGEKSG